MTIFSLSIILLSALYCTTLTSCDAAFASSPLNDSRRKTALPLPTLAAVELPTSNRSASISGNVIGRRPPSLLAIGRHDDDAHVSSDMNYGNREGESFERPDRGSRQHRRSFFQCAISTGIGAVVTVTQNPTRVNAAPPMAVIAEELGYFPVTDKNGKTIYIPARVKRPSTEQASLFAAYLQKTNAVMYGAFWCPHCKNQKEIFGREAWSKIRYVECDIKGADSNVALCASQNVNGFPEWKFGNGKKGSGEMSLEALVKLSGYKGKFDGSLEPTIAAPTGSCR